MINDLNVLCLLLTSSLRDSDPGYSVFIQASDSLFRAGLVASPKVAQASNPEIFKVKYAPDMHQDS